MQKIIFICFIFFPVCIFANSRCNNLLPKISLQIKDAYTIEDQLKLYSNYYDICKSNENYNYNYGLLFYNNNDFQQAKLYIENAINLKKEASYFYLLGLVEFELKNSELARKNFKLALQENKAFFQASLGLAKLLLDDNNINEAIVVLEKASEISTNTELSLTLAKLYYKTFNYINAKKILHGLLSENRNILTEVLKILVLIEYNQKNYEELNTLYDLYPYFFIENKEFRRFVQRE